METKGFYPSLAKNAEEYKRFLAHQIDLADTRMLQLQIKPRKSANDLEEIDALKHFTFNVQQLMEKDVDLETLKTVHQKEVEQLYPDCPDAVISLSQAFDRGFSKILDDFIKRKS